MDKSLWVSMRLTPRQGQTLSELSRLAGGNRSAVVRALLDQPALRLPKLPAEIAAAIAGEVER